MNEENIIHNNDNKEDNNNDEENNNEEDNNIEEDNNNDDDNNIEEDINNDEDNNIEEDNNNEEDNNDESNFETLKVDYNKLISLPDNIEIFEGKFSLLTHFQEKCFDPNTYVKENKIKIKNEKDEIEYKYIPLENYIRWKYNKNKQIISNAKMVEWNDGSFSVIIGEKYFDVDFSSMNSVRFGIQIDENTAIINQNINKRMLLQVDENQENEVIYDEGDKSKVKVSYSYYNKNVYNKDDFVIGFKKRRNILKEHDRLQKKRKREKNEKNEE